MIRFLRDVLRRAPLLSAILVIWLILTLLSLIGRGRAYSNYSTEHGKLPGLSLVMRGLHDHVLPWSEEAGGRRTASASSGSGESGEKDNSKGRSSESEIDASEKMPSGKEGSEERSSGEEGSEERSSGEEGSEDRSSGEEGSEDRSSEKDSFGEMSSEKDGSGEMSSEKINSEGKSSEIEDSGKANSEKTTSDKNNDPEKKTSEEPSSVKDSSGKTPSEKTESGEKSSEKTDSEKKVSEEKKSGEKTSGDTSSEKNASEDQKTENAGKASPEQTASAGASLKLPITSSSPVVQAKDYGVAEKSYLSPDDTVYNTDTEGLFAATGPFLKLQEVDDSYFKDALFVGDSRTVGLYEYGGMSSVTSFLARESTTIYDLFNPNEMMTYSPKGRESSQRTMEDLLSKAKFKKIYLSVGVNELGVPDTKDYYEEFRKVIKKVHKLQPEAIIYIQGIMHVSKAMSSSDRVYNNKAIVQRNSAIATLANGRTIFYIDMNSLLCDENGDLRTDLSGDGIHLKASACTLWHDFLKRNAVVVPEKAAEKDA